MMGNLVPKVVPSRPPRITATIYKGNSGGSEQTVARLPSSPAIELPKMKSAAMPDVVRRSDHDIKIMTGDKKMPPPVPVSPDRNPMPIPMRMLSQIGGS